MSLLFDTFLAYYIDNMCLSLYFLRIRQPSDQCNLDFSLPLKVLIFQRARNLRPNPGKDSVTANYSTSFYHGKMEHRTQELGLVCGLVFLLFEVQITS